jgi:sugar fermentation stimulation protein A
MLTYPQPLIPATLKKRYKRFLADVCLEDGTCITVHCPNSGSMKTCAEPDSRIMLSDSHNPARKYRYTWEMIRIGRTWVGIHSAKANDLTEHAIKNGHLTQVQGYTQILREKPYGHNKRSRIDFFLSGPHQPDTYLEVKFSTMRRGHYAAFPDAVTTRGTKHLQDLIAMRKAGCRAMLLFLVGRNDCRRFQVARDIDPTYAETLDLARKEGVEILVYRLKITPQGVKGMIPLPMDL